MTQCVLWDLCMLASPLHHCSGLREKNKHVALFLNTAKRLADMMWYNSQNINPCWWEAVRFKEVWEKNPCIQEKLTDSLFHPFLFQTNRLLQMADDLRALLCLRFLCVKRTFPRCCCKVLAPGFSCISVNNITKSKALTCLTHWVSSSNFCCDKMSDVSPAFKKCMGQHYESWTCVFRILNRSNKSRGLKAYQMSKHGCNLSVRVYLWKSIRRKVLALFLSVAPKSADQNWM